MTVENKKEEIIKLIATIWQEMEEEEFSDIVGQQVTTLIDHFKGKVTTHLPKMHKDITKLEGTMEKVYLPPFSKGTGA